MHPWDAHGGHDDHGHGPAFEKEEIGAPPVAVSGRDMCQLCSASSLQTASPCTQAEAEEEE